VLLVFGCLISRGLRNSDANKSKSKADKYFPQKLRNVRTGNQEKQMHSKKMILIFKNEATGVCNKCFSKWL